MEIRDWEFETEYSENTEVVGKLPDNIHIHYVWEEQVERDTFSGLKFLFIGGFLLLIPLLAFIASEPPQQVSKSSLSSFDTRPSGSTLSSQTNVNELSDLVAEKLDGVDRVDDVDDGGQHNIEQEQVVPPVSKPLPQIPVTKTMKDD
eukprot:TRINITY_DN1575_c0_g2_i2.p1 TRINITY_DN1575_c0_g2~~TRINITY_DN1575_c0_g2_i2.p1  ORF type:complete len:147 (+),score=50.31 TRINITY_DN1575_c0_g2_i2:772-1212(+)